MLQRLAGKDAQIAAAQRAEEVAIVSLSCLPALALCSAESNWQCCTAERIADTTLLHP